MTVRRHATFATEPTTQQHLQTVLSQASVKDITGEDGKTTVLIWLDVDALGESMGPHGQPKLRKRAVLDIAVLRKLVHGAILGHHGQKKSDTGEATLPAPGDVVVLYDGGRGKTTRKELRSLFRLQSSRNDIIDCEEKLVTLVHNEESVRMRKQRVRGSEAYSQQGTMAFYSSKQLIPDMIPEVKRNHYPGYNTGDVVGWVTALPPSALWRTSRPTAG